jgi:hypothetical protein
VIVGWLTDSAGDALTVGVTLIGGAIALFGAIAISRAQEARLKLLIFDSLRRSIRRTLLAPVELELDKAVKRGALPTVSLTSPVQVVHLSEALAYAASDPSFEHLYTTLMEVDKVIRHLNTLGTFGPLIRVSSWGVGNSNPAAVEDASGKLNAEEWRQWRLSVNMLADRDRFTKYMYDLLKQAESELEAVLNGMGMREFQEPDPPRPLKAPDLGQDLEDLINAFARPYSPEDSKQVGIILRRLTSGGPKST